MTALNRALFAETLKLKRTLALWLTLLTPGALVFLEVAAVTQQQGNLIQPDTNGWLTMFEHAFSIWVILIFPLFVTLETALLGQLETGSRTWKLVYSQPVPRWAIVAAKQIWSLGLVALGTVALIGLTLVGGVVLNIILPELNLQGPIPWGEMFRQSGITFLAAGIIVALHSWIALRSGNFVFASAIGIGMTIAGLVLGGLDWTEFFPWSMPAKALYQYYDGAAITTYLAVGLIGWLGFSLVGNRSIARMEIGG